MSQQGIEITLKEFLLDNFDCRPYSGRRMYGKQCVGIETNNTIKLISEMIGAMADVSEGNEGFLELSKAIRKAKTDSMGLDEILYFPDISWED